RRTQGERLQPPTSPKWSAHSWHDSFLRGSCYHTRKLHASQTTNARLDRASPPARWTWTASRWTGLFVDRDSGRFKHFPHRLQLRLVAFHRPSAPRPTASRTRPALAVADVRDAR